ncbi:alpha/beta fold hydrolase [Actinomadura viridis]|uniref:Pimeloyl-ACP methyl ester carboxylesterase n=1 Tax=Actinomadura viridis TaxID=58110 RepID=A0A931GQE7_9ACTN|nr:alpha/beta hydrolase [Actinomadura viridis]MBG6091656.1 pimeloyl-ACP methyl ester carboxylesterase [Actinomadura viridis]
MGDGERDEQAVEAARPAPSGKKGRRRRRLMITAGIVVAAAVALAFALRTPSPVGHWRSAGGQAHFMAAYTEAMRDMPQPAATIDVRTDFGFVRVYRFEGAAGRAEPLVLLPGRASATPVWADNMPALLRIGDVYTIDLLGEPGKSVQEVPITSDADQAEWLDQVLARLPEKSFHVVGLSIGGWTAANLAVHRPGHVATLTLIDPVYTFSGIPLGTAVRAIPASVPWLPKSWRDSFNSYTAGGAPVEDVPVANMIESGMKNYALHLPQPALLGEKPLRRLAMPVLAILAGKSVMHDVGASRAVAGRAFRNGAVKVYPDASHAINGEYPDKVAADIAAFLDAR